MYGVYSVNVFIGVNVIGYMMVFGSMGIYGCVFDDYWNNNLVGIKEFFVY